VNKLLKLHLGCGTSYLKGYVNVDYPQESHTTIKIKADKYADLRTLEYPAQSVEEIRLHHVFEHFSRQWALKLLSSWRRWLVAGGTLIIETPDFDECVRLYQQSNLPYRFKLLRQIFGSHEAHWAIHWDGWGEEKFRFVLQKFGFEDLQFKKVMAYYSTLSVPKIGGVITRTPFEKLKNVTGDRLPNITVIAKKSRAEIDETATIKEVLKLSIVGKETKMYSVWLKEIGL